MLRKEHFRAQSIFHIFNKSIANFGIFKGSENAQRFIETIDYYNNSNIKKRFSVAKEKKEYYYQNLLVPKFGALIKTLGFCIMPDHYHLLVKVQVDNILSKYMGDVENSFCRYFNLKFNRKGPLWQSCFHAVRIRTNEQLLHVSRYIHLNPTTAGLVEKPEDWLFSSYKNFISDKRYLKEIITEISINNPLTYQKFVEDSKDYQRKLKQIKKLILE